MNPIQRAFHILLSIGGGYLVTLIVPTMAMFAAWLPGGRERWFYVVARWWAYGVLFCCRVKMNLRTEGEIEWDRPMIVMSNHESQLDIPILFVAFKKKNVSFLAKHTVRNVPLFGWAMRAAGFIFVDRTNPEKAKASIDRAVEQVRAGSSVVVFPEGTRSSGEEMLPFKKGGFVLAVQSGVPVIPVFLHGSKHLQPKEDFVPHPGSVEVRIGAPMDPSGYTMETKDEFLAEVRAEIERLGSLQ